MSDLGTVAIDALTNNLTIDELTYGPDHPEVASDLNKLGIVLVGVGHPDAAKALFERALSIHETQMGPQHPQVAADLVNISEAYRALGDLRSAKDVLQRALSIDETAHGPRHPSSVRDMSKLCRILIDLGEMSLDDHTVETVLSDLDEPDERSSIKMALQSLGLIEADLDRLRSFLPAEVTDLVNRIAEYRVATTAHGAETESLSDHPSPAPLQSIAESAADTRSQERETQTFNVLMEIDQSALPKPNLDKDRRSTAPSGSQDSSSGERQEALQEDSRPDDSEATEETAFFNDLGNVFSSMKETSPELESSGEPELADDTEDPAGAEPTATSVADPQAEDREADADEQTVTAELDRVDRPDQESVSAGDHDDEDPDGVLEDGLDHFFNPPSHETSDRGKDLPVGRGNDLNNQGRLLRDLGDLAGAKDLFEQALAANEAEYGPDDTSVASDLSGLGGVLRDMGDLQGAREAFERSLAINERVMGENDPSIAGDLSDLGGIQHDLGNLDEAREALQRAISLNETALGPEHPSLSTDLNSLAGVLSALGDLNGAKSALERALTIDQSAYGPDHPKVATRLSNLGNILRAQQDLFGAKSCLQKALSITQSALGSDNPRVAIRMNNLANVLRDLGDPFAARPYLEQALTIDESAYGSDHPRIAARLTNLANVQQVIGNQQEAVACLERAVAITEAAFGRNDSRYLNRMAQLQALRTPAPSPAAPAAEPKREVEAEPEPAEPPGPKPPIKINSLDIRRPQG